MNPLQIRESRRLAALAETGLLDSPREKLFDDIAKFASKMCRTPIGLVTFVAEHRQWFKAVVGLGVSETERCHSFCAHALDREEPLVICDTRLDPRTSMNPLVRGALPGVISPILSYAGAPIVLEPGIVLGTVCVADHKPREFSTDELELLTLLSRQVATEALLRRTIQHNRRQLAHSAALERMAARCARMGGWIYRVGNNTIYWSEQMSVIHEVPVDYVPTLEEAVDFYPPEYRDEVRQHVERCLVEGTPFDFELEIITGKGRRIPVRAVAEAIRDESGAIISMQGAFQDISERKTAAASLAKLAARLRQVAESIPFIIWTATPDGRIDYNNHHFFEFTGTSRETAPAQRWQPCLHPDDLPRCMEAWMHAVKTGTRYAVEMRLKNASSGSYEWFQVEGNPIRDPDGTIVLWYGIGMNIHETRSLREEANRLAQESLRRQRMESIGNLARGMAHELNNLLAPILMGADLLGSGNLDTETRSILKDIRTCAKRGTGLVREVLSYAGDTDGKRLPVHLPALLHDIEAIIKNTFPKNIRLRSKIENDLWTVLGDATQIQQVILNLCVNARDAMPAGGQLSLVLSNHHVQAETRPPRLMQEIKPGRYVRIEVADEGSGIRPELLDRIFEPFFTTKDFGQGTGLGLSTAIGIIHAHGGFIDLHSKPGEGSNFLVYLPATTEVAANNDSQNPFQQHPQGRGETILLVEDEPTIRRIVVQALESHGYRVITADDGATGVSRFADEAGKVDLIISDMMMPVMDGSAFVAAIRTIRSDIPVIAISGMDADINLLRTSNPGIRCFLNKPFTIDQLLSALRVALDPQR